MAQRVNFSKRGLALLESEKVKSGSTAPSITDAIKAQESLSLLKRKLQTNPEVNHGRRNPSRSSVDRENLLRNTVSPGFTQSKSQMSQQFPSQASHPSFGASNPSPASGKLPATKFTHTQPVKLPLKQNSTSASLYKSSTTAQTPCNFSSTSSSKATPASHKAFSFPSSEPSIDDRLPVSIGGKRPFVPETIAAGDLIICPKGCGRSFNEKALRVHERVCLSVFQKKRKEFDVTKQRLNGLELPLASKTKPKQQAQMPVSKPKISKWKLDSHNLRTGMRQARGLPPPVAAGKDQVLLQEAQQHFRVKCDHCGRFFDTQVAQRHVPFCANKQKMNQMKNVSKPQTNPRKR